MSEPTVTVPISEWKLIAFTCVQCKSQACVNPNDSREFGCQTCGGSTHSVFIHFRPMQPKRDGSSLRMPTFVDLI